VKIIATYDFLFGHGNSCEVIRRGEDFTPPATSQMSREDHARSLINVGAAMTPGDWAKKQGGAA
jgi:hypothetical protein